jgi:hypothetical protein
VFGFLKLLRPREAGAPEEKVEAIFEMVREIRDELKPVGPTGERTSRLEMLVGAVARLSPGERENLISELESLEVDDQIVKFVAKPKTIEEISDKIKRSYGYTANRLRALMKSAKVARKRDAVTRKYVYVKA